MVFINKCLISIIELNQFTNGKLVTFQWARQQKRNDNGAEGRSLI